MNIQFVYIGLKQAKTNFVSYTSIYEVFYQSEYKICFSILENI